MDTTKSTEMIIKYFDNYIFFNNIHQDKWNLEDVKIKKFKENTSLEILKHSSSKIDKC